MKAQIGTQAVTLAQIGSGQWQAVFAFPIAALSGGQSTVHATLTASRSDGSSASIPVSINVAQP